MLMLFGMTQARRGAQCASEKVVNRDMLSEKRAREAMRTPYGRPYDDFVTFNNSVCKMQEIENEVFYNLVVH